MSRSDDLKFEYGPGYLVVRASGRYPIEQKEEAVSAIAAAIRARPVRAALIDGRKVDGPFSFMERYQLGEVAGLYLKQVPIAVLAREEQTDKQLIGKLVATNRGANLEVFTQLAEAEAWLKLFATPDAPGGITI
jgi:hypothetical protein